MRPKLVTLWRLFITKETWGLGLEWNQKPSCHLSALIMLQKHSSGSSGKWKEIYSFTKSFVDITYKTLKLEKFSLCFAVLKIKLYVGQITCMIWVSLTLHPSRRPILNKCFQKFVNQIHQILRDNLSIQTCTNFIENKIGCITKKKYDVWKTKSC